MVEQTFYFNKRIKIKKVFNDLIRSPKDQKIFKTLSENFFVPHRVIIKGNNIENYYKGENIYYNVAAGGFSVDKLGFVEFNGMLINVIDPIITLRKDLYAYLVLPPLTENSLELDEETIIKSIKKFGIKKIINQDKIRNALENARKGTGSLVLIAKGKKSIDGRAYQVKLFIDLSKNIGQVKEDGTIDFKEINSIKNIKKGTIIGEYIPEIKPEDGYDVFGHIKSARYNGISNYKLGKNLKIDKNNNIVSTIDGVISVTDDKVISISDKVLINGDVSLETGNIKTNINIVITGKVQEGFKVEAGKNISVRDSIVKANVRARGNIKVKNGIIGDSNKYKIIAGGEIHTGYLEYANVWAAKDIYFSKSIIHSLIQSGGKIIATGKGVVIGGKIVASNGIEVIELGSKLSVPTEVVVGIDLQKELKLRSLNNQHKMNNIEIRKIKLAIGESYFKNPEKYLATISEDRFIEIEEHLENLFLLMEKQKQIEQQIKKLNKSLTYPDAKIVVKKACYEGVTIFMGQTKFQVFETLKNVTIYWDDESKTISYKYNT